MRLEKIGLPPMEKKRGNMIALFWASKVIDKMIERICLFVILRADDM